MMEVSRPGNLLQDKRLVWVVGAIIAAIFALTNLPWHLDDYDQAKQAFTSFEMIKEGHWLYQRTPQGRVATKPPLAGWISASLFAVTRSWEVAWRLPSFAAAIAISVILFRTGSVYGAAAGLIALSAFGLNLLSSRLATLVRTDMLLALIIFLIGLFIWRKVRTNEPWRARDRIGMGAFLTAGMLIKGPSLYAFLLPGIVSFELWRWKSRAVAQSAWCGWWPWAASLAVFLLWAWGGIQNVPAFYEQVVLREFLGRFGETIHRPQPIYFYLPHLLHKFAPWSLLLIGLAIFLGPSRAHMRSAISKITPEAAWLLCWIVGGLVVMSLIPSKRVDRIFPVVPPLCLLLASLIGKGLAREGTRSRIYRWSAVAVVIAILFTGCYAGFKIFTGYRERRSALVEFGQAVRAEAAANQWRYAVVSGRDEGLLLYLDKTQFLKANAAVMEWNSGNINALVVPLLELARYQQELSGVSLPRLHSAPRKGERTGYILLERAQP